MCRRGVIVHYSLLANAKYIQQICGALAITNKSGCVIAWKAIMTAEEVAGLRGSGRWCETINLVCPALCFTTVMFTITTSSFCMRTIWNHTSFAHNFQIVHLFRQWLLIHDEYMPFWHSQTSTSCTHSYFCSYFARWSHKSYLWLLMRLPVSFAFTIVFSTFNFILAGFVKDSEMLKEREHTILEMHGPSQ